MRYWMMKSEPSVYSIDDLKRDKKTAWEGVRNYQARNMMRDDMQVGDMVLFYHSNANPPGIAGIARICHAYHPDKSSLDPKSKYFDPKSSPENPIWYLVDVAFVEKFANFISLKMLHAMPELKELKVLQKGSRLSILPVEAKHFQIIQELGRKQ